MPSRVEARIRGRIPFIVAISLLVAMAVAVRAYEIGAFGYPYPGPILDLWGLVSPQVVGQNSAKIIESSRPQWIMSYLDMVPENVRDSIWFQREYKSVYALGAWEGRRATLFRRFPPAEEGAEATGMGVLGNSLQLLDVAVSINPLGPDVKAVHATLTWKALQGMDRRYSIFVHLNDVTNSTRGQHDGEPQGNEYPTTAWQVGETIVDKHDLLVNDASLGGEPLLVLGAYETGTADRLMSWSNPTVPAWPHELRISLSKIVAR